MANNPIPPCPMPGCGGRCAKEIGNGYVRCHNCGYRTPSLAAHEQVCAAMEFVEKIANACSIPVDNKNASSVERIFLAFIREAKAIRVGG